MTIKQFKNKTFLLNDLIEEQYVINNNNQNEIIEEIIIDKPILVTQEKQNLLSSEINKKSSPYNIFVTKTTNKLKLTNPTMLAKNRKVELSRLWKLEKDKII